MEDGFNLRVPAPGKRNNESVIFRKSYYSATIKIKNPETGKPFFWPHTRGSSFSRALLSCSALAHLRNKKQYNCHPGILDIVLLAKRKYTGTIGNETLKRYTPHSSCAEMIH